MPLTVDNDWKGKDYRDALEINQDGNNTVKLYDINKKPLKFTQVGTLAAESVVFYESANREAPLHSTSRTFAHLSQVSAPKSKNNA